MDTTKLTELLSISQGARLLYVEDDENARVSMMLILEQIFQNITIAVDGEEGLNSFKTGEYDLIITDIIMPKMKGTEMIIQIRKISKDIPILILSASSEANVFTETIALGIDGYLLKPIEITQLIATLMKTMQKIKLIHENEVYKHSLEEKVKERTEQIVYQSFHDLLTHTKNQVSLQNDVQNSPRGTMFLINIDSLKQYNELYGMETGDEILKALADVLDKFAAHKPFEVYRVYGDTFALYDREINPDERGSREELDGLVDLLENFSIFIPSLGDVLNIDATVVLIQGEDQPIEKSEMAMQYAKENKKEFIIYDTSIHSNEKNKHDLYWRSEIKEAISQGCIVPFFQPIVNRGMRANKVEVLMRLVQIQEEERIPISPLVFLEISKKTKQYGKLTQIIVEKSFEIMAEHSSDFSINLSYYDIKDEDCQVRLKTLIERYNLGHRLIFEILESEYIQDFKLVKNFITAFKKLGVRIAIDDFGTGYSNFSHILELQPEYIKIDGSLIQKILTNPASLVLVKAIIQFSKELQIKVVAEFVSSKEIFDTLFELEVDEFQGYCFSEPLPKPMRADVLLGNSW